MAKISGTTKLNLNQFSEINDYIYALCYARAGKILEFEEQVSRRKNVPYSVITVIESLSGKKSKLNKGKVLKVSDADLSRFQVLTVDRSCAIKDFVEDNGLLFNTGRGFYEFTKRETIQAHKEVIAQDTYTGEVLTGNDARRALGIPVGKEAKVSPNTGRYKGFVQSTSYNRKLVSGTDFLYEVDYSR